MLTRIKLLTLFFGASVSAAACASVLGVDDIPYTGALDATTVTDGNADASEAESEDAGPNACRPVVCATDGGDGGLQCGEGYSSCGSYFNCGACTSGARSTCDFHLCACAPSTCGDHQAACGSFSNECGGDLDCGACSGDASCQASDSGTFAFACAAGACVPSPSTCNGKCNDVTDNCGAIQHCGGCSDHSFCGLTGATSCTCPARDQDLVETFFGSYGTHCWGDCPSYYPAGNVVAHLYASPTTALAPLFRCDLTNGQANPAFLLTVSPTCEALNQAPAQTVGYCAHPGGTPTCGAAHLHRYKSAGGDRVAVVEGNAPPAGYTIDEGVLCDVWVD